MHRFFSSSQLTEQLRLLSSDSRFHQILKVFRSKEGDIITFFEVGKDDSIYEITSINKKEIQLTKKETITKTNVSKSAIRIFQSYPNKISTMEIIVQKMVELGIPELSFFASEHSQIREISENKKQRLKSISLEALEQSGNNIPIKILYLDGNNIQTLLRKETSGSNNTIIACPEGKMILSSSIISNASLWVGPEGGWSKDEKDFFTESNLTMWAFNGNILRMETASIVGAGILSYLL